MLERRREICGHPHSLLRLDRRHRPQGASGPPGKRVIHVSQGTRMWMALAAMPLPEAAAFRTCGVLPSRDAQTARFQWTGPASQIGGKLDSIIVL